MYGIFIVLISLITFVSVVWLKDQLGHGIGRNWFDEDQQEANPVWEDGNLENAAQVHPHERARQTQGTGNGADGVSGRSPLSIFLRSQVDLLGEIQTDSTKESLQELWRSEVDIMHRLDLDLLEYQDVLVSARRRLYNGLQEWRSALSGSAATVSNTEHCHACIGYVPLIVF